MRKIFLEQRSVRKFLRELLERAYPTRQTIFTEQLRDAEAKRLYHPAFNGLCEDSTVPEFLLDQVKDEARLKVESLRALEQKAGTQITIAGTIIAIFSAFNRHVDQRFVFIPLIFLALAIVISVWTLWVRSDALPSPGLYNYRPVLTDDANRPRIAANLAEDWNNYSLDLQLYAGRKAVRVKASWILILLGLLALFAVAFYAPGGSGRSTVSCIISLKGSEYVGQQSTSGARGRSNSTGRVSVGSPRGRLQSPPKRTLDYARCYIPSGG